MPDQEDDKDRAEREFSTLMEAVDHRLNDIRPAYAQALTQLWLGNAGGAVTVLSFVGATARSGVFPHMLLWPLWLFVLGLISMGVGAGLWLFSERHQVRRMEEANSLLDVTIEDGVMRPTQLAGLTLKDWRTRAAILSAVFFVAGCAAGLLELTVAN